MPCSVMHAVANWFCDVPTRMCGKKQKSAVELLEETVDAYFDAKIKCELVFYQSR